MGRGNGRSERKKKIDTVPSAEEGGKTKQSECPPRHLHSTGYQQKYGTLYTETHAKRREKCEKETEQMEWIRT